MGSLRILVSRARRHILRHSVPVAAGGVLVTYDIITLGNSAPLLLAGGVASVIYGAYEIVHEFHKDVQELKKIYPSRVPIGSIHATYEDPYDSWTVIANSEGNAITCETLNNRLAAEERFRVNRNSAMWKPLDRIERIRQLVGLRLDADEAKIRLSSDLLVDSSDVSIEKTNYSAFLVTNHTAMIQSRRRGEDRPLIDYAETFLLDGRLPRLARSKLSNHIGVDVIGIEPDRIILVLQSSNNTLSPGLLAPSGSGSADWADANPGAELVDVVKTAMLREMAEELGLSQPLVPSRSAVRVVGYGRLTHLGGKPQFYGLCKLPKVRERVTAREERYTDDFLTIDLGPDPTADRFIESIDRFKTVHSSSISFPLYMTLTLTVEWLIRDEAASRWLGLKE